MYISTFSLYQMEKKWCEMRLTLYDRAKKKGRYLVYVLNPDKTKGPPGLSFFWTLWAGAAGFKSLQHSDKKEGEMDIPTSDTLDPALVKMLGVWYGESIQLVLPTIRREVLFLHWLISTH